MALIYLFIGVGMFAIGAGIWGYASQRKMTKQDTAI
jgi:hypothetical protein